MTIYKSKISLALALPVALVLVVTTLMLAFQKSWSILAFMLVVDAFIVHLFFTTYYIVDEAVLKVKSGIFINQTIPIASIKSITETNNLLSSPALSLDRLEIRYRKYDRVIVSPEDKGDFVDHLVKINPAIAVGSKNKSSS